MKTGGLYYSVAFSTVNTGHKSENKRNVIRLTAYNRFKNEEQRRKVRPRPIPVYDLTDSRYARQ